MIGLLQRVSAAQVQIGGHAVASIATGLLVLIGIERADSEETTDRLLQRVLTFRVFPDALGKMNLSVQDVRGGVLLVPQFTLVADTDKGARASFVRAAEPEQGQHLFAHLIKQAQVRHTPIAAGVFGADMQVTLTNDGPVTFWLKA